MADSEAASAERVIDLQIPADIRELRIIRKLLSVALLKSGLMSQQEIADILGVDRSVVSRMFPGVGHRKKRG